MRRTCARRRSRAPRPQSSNGLDVFDVVMHHLLSLDSARPRRKGGATLSLKSMRHGLAHKRSLIAMH